MKEFRILLICCAGVVMAAGLLGLAQTKTDLRHQAKNLHGLIEPRPGTVIVCAGDRNCESYPDGSSVVYRVLPPAGPGPCAIVGTGAFSVDENGYMYWCSPPWMNPNGSVWMRTAQPMVSTWTPDRPPGAPSQRQ